MKLTIKESYGDAKYSASSYYDERFYGLEDSFETDDFSELEAWVWDKLQQCYVEVQNSETGNRVKLALPKDSEYYDYIDPNDCIIWSDKYGWKNSGNLYDALEESVKRKRRIKESGEPFTTFDSFSKSDISGESAEQQLRNALDMFILRDDVDDQRYGSWKVKFEDGTGKPELAMSISYYGDIVCRMYYDRGKGYTLKCERVPELDFDIDAVVRDVLDDHGIIVR